MSDEFKTEKEISKYEEYLNSESEDDFQTYKLKEHIDNRFYKIIGIIIGIAIVLLISH